MSSARPADASDIKISISDPAPTTTATQKTPDQTLAAAPPTHPAAIEKYTEKKSTASPDKSPTITPFEIMAPHSTPSKQEGWCSWFGRGVKNVGNGVLNSTASVCRGLFTYDPSLSKCAKIGQTLTSLLAFFTTEEAVRLYTMSAMQKSGWDDPDGVNKASLALAITSGLALYLYTKKLCTDGTLYFNVFRAQMDALWRTVMFLVKKFEVEEKFFSNMVKQVSQDRHLSPDSEAYLRNRVFTWLHLDPTQGRPTHPQDNDNNCCSGCCTGCGSCNRSSAPRSSIV